MGWGLDYALVELSAAEKASRRLALDRWGALAHVSSLAPLGVLLFLRLARFVADVARQTAATSAVAAAAQGKYRHPEDDHDDNYDEYEYSDPRDIPHSPQLKSARQSARGGLAAAWRRVVWWFGADVTVPGSKAAWGTRWVWVASLLWLAWLGALCVVETGNDYLHLTKRVGHVAASQLPLHYLLSLKALSPAAAALGSSHEHVNKWHRALGRIIALLLAIHSALYLGFFVYTATLAEHLGKPVVIFGLVAVSGIAVLYATALTPLRTRSYRLFFVVHVVVAVALPVLVWLHVHHALGVRLYAAEALVGFLVDVAYRRATATTVQARVEAVPGTDLIRITAPLPARKLARFAANPGAHVHVNIPPEARPHSSPLHPASLPYAFSYNPLSVAAVDDKGAATAGAGRSRITLVARRQRGLVTRNLARYADAGVDLDMPLRIEGPYGAAGQRFARLRAADVDRFLIVAGGVGATFAVPIYCALVAASEASLTPAASRVSFVWVVRAAADASWAVGPTGRRLADEPNVAVYVTGPSGDDARLDDSESGGLLANDAVEMAALDATSPSSPDGSPNAPAQWARARPDWARVVDGVFSRGREERVGVLVCGPQGMARDVRGEVGRWVARGREVVWHDEAFSLG